MSQSITLQELAALVGGSIKHGDPDSRFTGLNSLSDAVPGDISFLGNPRYLPQVSTTAASAILVSLEFAEQVPHVALVEVANPTLAFSAVIAHFSPPRRQFTPGVHSTAYVASSAKLGDNVHVGPLAIVEDDAVIGAGCVIQAGAFVGQGARLGVDCFLHPKSVVKDYCVLGARVIVHSSAVIGSDGFGYEFTYGRYEKIDQVGIVEVGDDVEIGASSTIDRARFGKTIIGEGTKIDNLVQIAHNVTTGKHCAFASQVGISGSTRLGDNVVMGGQSGAAGHLKIADAVIVLGRGGVTKNLLAPGRYTGFPARPLNEGRRLLAAPALVPGLIKRVRALEGKLGTPPADSAAD
jgi:UDP-3-O-[3-hydroxymyristoyl] glucosamine N-acyltransferase